MAFTVDLIEGSEPAIGLYYLVDDGWSMLDRGFEPNDPERIEVWGGYLENILVRQEDGKRTIPLRLFGQWSSADEVIDAVNALEERLRHAARYRIGGWGDEVFLQFQLHGSTFGVDFPACSGQINKADVMNVCNMSMDGAGERELTTLTSIGVTLVCEPYWEATETYTLENYIDNPGWWRGAAPGDSWTEVNGADVTSTIDTTIYEVMGQSLKQIYIVDAVNDTGVVSDAQTVVASTDYYFEARNYRVTGCDTLTAQVYDISNGAIIAASALTFNTTVDAWEKQGVSFTTPVGCVSIRVELLCLAGDSVAGGTAYWDAIYLTPGTTAPVGWSSGRNLVNCLDGTADNINVLCVTEVPGEVEAEVKFTFDLDDTTSTIRLGKRTRDDPYNFIWQLTPCGAYTTAEGGGGACVPGLIDAACIDSDKVLDGTSPSGSRITVTFAGAQNMQPRCYWDITDDLASYRGKFALYVIAKMSGGTDTATIEISTQDETNYQGRRAGEGIGIDIAGTTWYLYEGWQTWEFRIGTSDNALFDTGNNWRIELWAETDGTPTDELHIAGAYLMPLEEGVLVGGTTDLAATADLIVKEMDGDRGVFAYSSTTNVYYPNLGAVGQYPLLNPKVENYIYLVSASPTYVFNDGFHVSLEYRPRGIFLRGSNP